MAPLLGVGGRKMEVLKQGVNRKEVGGKIVLEEPEHKDKADLEEEVRTAVANQALVNAKTLGHEVCAAHTRTRFLSMSLRVCFVDPLSLPGLPKTLDWYAREAGTRRANIHSRTHRARERISAPSSAHWHNLEGSWRPT